MLSERYIKLFGRDIKLSEQVNYVVRTILFCCNNNLIMLPEQDIILSERYIKLFGRDIKLL